MLINSSPRLAERLRVAYKSSKPQVFVTPQSAKMDERQTTGQERSVFPLQQLTPDLLDQIFHLCLPPYFDRRPSRAQAPLSLCQVSRKWRDSAQRCNLLWSRLLLAQDDRQTIPTNIQKFISASALWKDLRTRGDPNRPIDLQFNFDFGEWSHQNPYEGIPEIQSLVYPIASNVRDLSLEVQSEEQLEDWFLAQTTSLQGLESFHVSVTGTTDGAYSVYPILSHAPNLRYLCLDLYGNALCHPSRLPFPWSRLTHLMLPNQMLYEGWHQLIRLCPALTSCYVGFEDIGNEETDDDVYMADGTGIAEITSPAHPNIFEPVILSFLHTLIVGFHGVKYSPTIFAGLTCPTLSSLSIISEDLEAGFLKTQQPLDFYLRNASTLRYLNLTRQKITASDVLSILRVTVSLRELVLDCTGDHDPLFTALEVGPTQKNVSILPSLESLDLRIMGPSSAFEITHITSFESNTEEYYDAPRFTARPLACAIASRYLYPLTAKPFRVEVMVDTNDADRVEQLRSAVDLLQVYVKQGLLFTPFFNNEGVAGGEVAKVRMETWASWKFEGRFISM
ncbi:hypothetical protein H0H93_000661 [Arthromyces matolae]|nr:hypothetical protein H0H93_000661 [Arthromyces matolae]